LFKPEGPQEDVRKQIDDKDEEPGEGVLWLVQNRDASFPISTEKCQQ
jgi:hypothetical protein